MSSPMMQVRSRIPRIAEAAVDRARLTVVPRRRTRAARLPFVALLTVILLGGVVGLLMFNTSMQQASFAATTLQDQANTLDAKQQSLRMDLDRLRNPQRIAAAARKLGMVEAGNPSFIELGSGKVLGDPSAGSTPMPIWPAVRKPPVLDPAPHVVTVPAPAAAAGSGAAGSQSSGSQSTGSRDTSRGGSSEAAREGKKTLEQSPTHR